MMLFAGGCSSSRQAAAELDKVAASLDRFGFAGISTPFLTAATPAFKFDLNKSADWYFERALATVQGAVRTSDARAVDAQVALRINIEQALATVAQLQRARTVAEFREAKRNAQIQKQMLESTVSAVTPPPELVAAATGAVGAAVGAPPGSLNAALIQSGAAAANPAENPLVKATLGMLDVAANAPEPDTDPLPGYEPDTSPPPDKPPFEASDRLARAAVGGFSPNLPFPTESFEISARDALLIADGDRVTQALLNWFQYPADNRLGDYELFFCPIVVSVKPGYETRQGYEADITVTVDLARQRDGESQGGPNGLEYLSQKFPNAAPPVQVAGVFPLIDAQVLDLVSSRRRLYSMAFQLAMTGFGAQANTFMDYARRLEQDAQTRSSLTVASAYTIGANAFGFRVEPQYVALRGPTTLEAEPGDVLQSRSFPAMATLLVHRAYLYHRRNDVKDQVNDQGTVTREGRWQAQFDSGGVAESVTTAHRSGERPSNDSSRRAKYDYLVLRTGVRWSPTRSDGLLGARRVSEVDMWRRAEALDKAAHWVDSSAQGKRGAFEDQNQEPLDLLYGGPVPNHNQRAYLSSRMLTLQQIALDTQALIRIDQRQPEPVVRVTSVSPEHGWLDQPTVLTITGSGFDVNVESVTVGGRACTYEVVSDGCLLATVPAWRSRPDAASVSASFAASGVEPKPKALLETAAAPLHPDELMLLQIEARMAELQANDSARRQLQDLLNAQRVAMREAASSAAAQLQTSADRARSASANANAANVMGEVLIGARVPVLPPQNVKRPDGSYAAPPSQGAAPAGGRIVGWIVFDRLTPQPPSPAAPDDPRTASVRIERGTDGRICGVTTEGKFANSLELLKAVAAALPDPTPAATQPRPASSQASK